MKDREQFKEILSNDFSVQHHISEMESGMLSYHYHDALEILLQETGKVFSAVLEDAGVYKNTPAGREAFLRFVDAVNAM